MFTVLCEARVDRFASRDLSELSGSTATAAPAVATTQAITPTPEAVAADPANPCANLPVYAVGAVVATTAELNLREGPSTDSASVVVLPEGSRLQVTGEFQEAGQ